MKAIINRLTVFILVICLVLCSVPAQATFVETIHGSENKGNTHTLDDLDIWLIVGNQIVCEMNNDGCDWNERTKITEVIPLYDLDSTVVAYYVALSDGGYMVINNNEANPVIIEYSYSLDILREAEDSASPIDSYCYLCPGIFADRQEIDLNRSQINSIGYKQKISFDDAERMVEIFKNEMSTPDAVKENQLQTFRRFAQDNNLHSSRSQDSDYGFFNSNNLPTSSTTSNEWIPFSRSLNHYGTTGEFLGLTALYTIMGNPVPVNNHCVAVSAFNMLYYYRYILNDSIPLVNRQNIFLNVHSYIKNGPVTPDQYGSRFASYINNQTNYSYTYWLYSSNTWSNYTSTIDADHMAFILAWPSLLDAHTFNGIGYITYSTTEKYCRIIDGWNNSSDRFYLWSTALYALGYIVIS